MADTDKVNLSLNSLDINGVQGDESKCEEAEEVDETWGLSRTEVYKLALRFYKEKEGKAMHLTYKDKLKLVALTKQISFGKYSTGVAPAVGFLDVVGNDRIKVWQSLGEMSRDEAMVELIKVLDSFCPLFKPFVEAHKREKEEQERKRKEEIERQRKEEEEKERQRLEEEARERQDQQQQKQINQELQIRSALNQQTAVQFKQYAEQQCPGNLQQQEELIKQLQEQHFQQYMQQVYQQQLLHQQQQYSQMQNMSQGGTTPSQQPVMPVLQLGSNGVPTAAVVAGVAMQPGATLPVTTGNTHIKTIHQNHQPHQGENGEEENDDSSDLVRKMPPLVPASMWTTKDLKSFKDMVRKSPDNVIKISSLATATTIGTIGHKRISEDGYLPIAAPSMWTRKDIKEFKDSLRKDTDSIIKVGSGETVTVRVPTHEDGTCLFWEFATDSYDLGFGVYFEWTVAPSNQVSVHVSESSDEEDLEEEEGGGDTPTSKDDVERGSSTSSKKDENRPPTDEIIPVYRRDCHEEVYCGSHMYPGRGVYLLKFDNSYSLWRSKTLYYRVYYTR